MVSGGKGLDDEIQEESRPSSSQTDYNLNSELPIYIRSSERKNLDEEKHHNRFPNTLTTFQRIRSLFRFKFTGKSTSPSLKFWKIADVNDESQHSKFSLAGQSTSKRIRIPFIQKINWPSLWQMSKTWIKNPINMALFAWIACVAISGAILFLVMTGMLNGVLPRKSQRNTWFEVNNQILNALFTLMCLYQHPKRFHHLVLLCRWRAADVLYLRKIYCKNGTCKPNERMHIMIVVMLLHLNCFAQYALCSLNLGYPRSKRPAIGVGLCVSIAIAAPAVASVYNILSPIGRDYEAEVDQETDNGSPKSDNKHKKSLEKRYSFMSSEDMNATESKPEWIGGLFDFWDDICLAYLSLFCSCCLFGWNMDRLGFGNMYVHIATFLLFCLAPFFIFNLAAVNIDNETIRGALGMTGFVLCVLGLLYGGFWRIRMRKRFNLPPNNFCFGKAALTDCFQWLCCCACSLAQEVRTADFYDIVEGNFQRSDGTNTVMSPLPREDQSSFNNLYEAYSGSSSVAIGKSPSPERSSGGYPQDWRLPMVGEGSPTRVKDNMMDPPMVSGIQRDEKLA